MSRLEKLIARICSSPPEADFDDVERLLVFFGWRLRGCEGSHCIFVKDGEHPIVVPKLGGRTAKRRYCNVICERLGIGEDG